MTPNDAAWSDDALESAIVRAKGFVPAGAFGVIAQDSRGVIVATTEATLAILGLTTDQMSRHGALDPRWWALTCDGRPLAEDAHPSMVALATRRPQIGVIIGVYGRREPAGTYAWVTIDSFPLSPDQGHPAGAAVISCVAPVDDARAQELRIAQSERMLRAIIERSHEMVGIHSLDGTWVWVSPAVQRLLGYEPAELLGHNMFDVVHPDDVERGRAALATVLVGDDAVNVSVRALRKSGQTIWIEVIGQLIVDDTGHPFQVQTSTRDVTPRVLAEQARDAAVEVFTTVMANSPIGMALQDLDGLIRTSNRALHEMLQCDSSELVGTSLVDRVHPEDREWVATARLAVLDGDETGSRREARFELPGQSTIWVESTTVVLRAFDGTPTGFLEQLHDVTARKHAEADLQHRATSDPLTGLPNRPRFLDLLDEGIAAVRPAGHEISVLFLDLDGFKAVNDTHGHDVGDDLLREVAARLTAALADDGHATRYGGDEFAAMCRGSDAAAVDATVDRVIRALRGPFVVGDLQLVVTASVGRSTGAEKPAAQLLREADRSMYLAKRGRASS